MLGLERWSVTRPGPYVHSEEIDRLNTGGPVVAMVLPGCGDVIRSTPTAEIHETCRAVPHAWY